MTSVFLTSFDFDNAHGNDVNQDHEMTTDPIHWKHFQPIFTHFKIYQIKYFVFLSENQNIFSQV